MAEYTINNVQMKLDAEGKTILVTADIQRDAVALRALSVSIPASKSSAELIERIGTIARRIIQDERIKRQGIAKAVVALEGLVL